MSDEAVLKAAEEKAKAFLEIIKFDGKCDLEKMRSELSKLKYKGQHPHVEVTDDLNDVTAALLRGATHLYGDKAQEALDSVSPSLSLWDYYMIAYFESAYAGFPEEKKKIEFMEHSLFDACAAGLKFIINLGPLVVGVGGVEAYREDGRIHRADGPAIIWGTYQDYFWHGIQIPEKWIERKALLTKEDFRQITNQEQKRAFCEILGWEVLLGMIGSKKLSSDDWGDLIEAQLDDDDGKPARFADVRCPSTDRRYLIRTDPSVKTCGEALARSASVSLDDYVFRAES